MPTYSGNVPQQVGRTLLMPIAIMLGMLLIKKVSPFDSEVSSLIEKLDEYQKELYPPESNHLDPLEVLEQDNCLLVGAYEANSFDKDDHSSKANSVDENNLVGIGAIKDCGDYGELKRFYVSYDSRGKGVANLILSVLEQWLVNRGVLESKLETGIEQKPALAFYESHGYEFIKPFGDYKPDPLSKFMSKNLQSNKHDWPSEFFVVAFKSLLKSDFLNFANESTNIEPLGENEYQIVAKNMEKLVSAQKGYLGHSNFRNENGKGITFSYWKDEEAAKNWGQNSTHKETQELGRKKFYERFKTYRANVVLS